MRVLSKLVTKNKLMPKQIMKRGEVHSKMSLCSKSNFPSRLFVAISDLD